MAVMRINKTTDYTVMLNYHFREKDMSLKAKGLLSLMLSLPEDWDFTVKGLANLNKDGVDGVRAALEELKTFGYLRVTRERNEKGQVSGTVYDIYEKPTQEKPVLEEPKEEKPILEKPTQEKPIQENPTQLNTKGIKYLNNKILKESSTKGIKESVRAKKEPEQYFEDEELNCKFLEFLAMRKKIRKPVRTDRALKALLKKLHELSGGDLGMMKKIIDQSLDKEWLGFFELKTGNVSTNNINDRLYGDIQHWAAQKEQEGGGMYDDFGVF